MPVPAIILGIVQLLDIIAHRTNKYPDEADALQAAVPTLIGIASRASGETEAETAARLAQHDALIAKYANPPAGAAPAPLVKP